MRKQHLAFIGLIIIIMLIIIAIFPHQIATHDPLQIDTTNRLVPPSLQHYFGTDALGRDLFSRVIHGTRISLYVGFIVVFSATLIGTIFGTISGFFGGTVDFLIMRIVDSTIAFPVLILAMVVSAALGAGLTSAIIAMIIVFIPRYTRLMRGQVLSVINNLYVEGAHAIGAKRISIMFHYVIRNCFDPVLIKATLDIGFTIILTSALGFIGLGAERPLPEWGVIISDSQAYLMSAWWHSTFPGLAILITVLGWNFLGDGLRDMINPAGN